MTYHVSVLSQGVHFQWHIFNEIIFNKVFNFEDSQRWQDYFIFNIYDMKVKFNNYYNYNIICHKTQNFKISKKSKFSKNSKFSWNFKTLTNFIRFRKSKKKIKMFIKFKNLYIMNLIFFLQLDSLRFPI
jgi:hypothetical protein